ncbi:MAG: prepilin-type N-terminal cleavage/methylation domain-containing protein [Defluviitaleaceae bacterium]|nr:prepilin-type N-terminal cleavage/methylation domain-containing protein [Defluviitaleaceae bacterium]
MKRIIRKGFTMTELVVVLLIIAILAAAATPAILMMIESGRQMNRQNIARTLYLAAQNQLTEMRVLGRLEDFVNSTPINGPTETNVFNLLTAVPGFHWPDVGNEEHVHFISLPAGNNNPDNPVVRLLSPILTYQEVLNDAILIEFNVITGVVLSVIHSDRLEPNEEFTYGTPPPRAGNNNLVSGQRGMGYAIVEASNRRQGFYGVGGTGALPEELRGFTVRLVDSFDDTELPPLPPLLPPNTSYTGINSDNILFAIITIDPELAETAIANNSNFNVSINGITHSSFSLSALNAHNSFVNNLDGFYKPGNPTNDITVIWILDYVSGNPINGLDLSTISPHSKIQISVSAMGRHAISNSRHPHFSNTSPSGASFDIRSARHLHNIRYVQTEPSAANFTFNVRRDIGHHDTANAVFGGFPSIPRLGGTLNGNGHTLTDLAVYGTPGRPAGLFEEIVYTPEHNRRGIVEDITFINPYAQSDGDVGVIAGVNEGFIRNFTIDSPTVSGSSNVGGAAGVNKGYIQNFTINNPSISGNGNVGGAAGESEGYIQNFTIINPSVFGGGNVGGAAGSLLPGGEISGGAVRYENTHNSNDDVIHGITAGVNVGGFVGFNNGGTIRDSVFISPNENEHVTLTALTISSAVGGFVGRNAGGVLERLMFLAASPRNTDATVLYPIVGVQIDGVTPLNPSTLLYLSGDGLRPAVPAYNRTSANIGTPVDTNGLRNLFRSNTALWPGWVLQAMPNDSIAILLTNTAYPYPRFMSAMPTAIPDNREDWPIAAGATTLRYFEVYDDGTIGFYYYDENNTPVNTLALAGSGLIVVDDGYIIHFSGSAPAVLNVTFGNAVTPVAVPSGRNWTSAVSSLAELPYAARISDAVIINAFTTPITISCAELPDGIFFNPLFARQIYLTQSAQVQIPVRSPRQLANVRYTAGMPGLTYTQELDLDFEKYVGFNAFARESSRISAAGAFDSSIVNTALNSSAIYNGGGNIITGVVIDTLDSSRPVGLFIANEGTITNTHLRNSRITNPNAPFAGGIAANSLAGSTIRMASVENTVIAGNLSVGGIAGQNFGTLTRSFAVDTRVEGMNFVGGIVGINQTSGTVTYVFSSFTSGNLRSPQSGSWTRGVVRRSGVATAFGGLAGGNNGTLRDGYYAGFVGGEADDTVKPTVGMMTSGSVEQNLYFLYGEGFNSNPDFKDTDQGTHRTVNQLINHTSLSGMGNDIWENIPTTQDNPYPYVYPVLGDMPQPTTWCDPTAPPFTMLYYEVYLDIESGTTHIGLWGPNFDTIPGPEDNVRILADGYLLFGIDDSVSADVLTGNTLTITAHASQDPAAPGTTINNAHLHTHLVTLPPITQGSVTINNQQALILSTVALEGISQGWNPVYLRISSGPADNRDEHFFGWVNPLYAKGLMQSYTRHTIRTPRHIQNIGSIATTGRNFYQEIDVDFTHYNFVDGFGYVKVSNPMPLLGNAPTFIGTANTEMLFPQAGVMGIFNGSYDGNDRSVIGFRNTNADAASAGLFAEIGTNGVVHNLTVTNSVMENAGTSGILSSTNRGTVRDVTVKVSQMTATGNSIGGIAGINYGTIYRSDVEHVTINATGNNIGGFAGINHGTVGTVIEGEDDLPQIVTALDNTLSGINNVGGIAGTNEGIIVNAYTMRTGTDDDYAFTADGNNLGGIAGFNSGTVRQSAVEKQVLKGTSNVGGIVGYNDDGLVTDVYYIDTRNEDEIDTDKPLTGIIMGTPVTTGGIVGYNDDGTVTRALFLGIAPQRMTIEDKLNDEGHEVPTSVMYIHPIVGGGEPAEVYVVNGETYHTCFFVSGVRYMLDSGVTLRDGDYNYLSNVAPHVSLSGGGTGMDTAFLELEFVNMMDASASWDHWTYGVRAGARPYPYAILYGMTPPANWHETSGSLKPPQQDREMGGWHEPTEGVRRSGIQLENPNFDMPLLAHDRATEIPLRGVNTDVASNFTTIYRQNGMIYNSVAWNDSSQYYPMTAIQGWWVRPTATGSTHQHRDAIQLFNVLPSSLVNATAPTGTANIPTGRGQSFGRVRTDHLGGTNGFYAELAAQEAGTLFQIVETRPLTEVYYSFYHATRGDNSADSMNLYLSGVTGFEVETTRGVTTTGTRTTREITGVARTAAITQHNLTNAATTQIFDIWISTGTGGIPTTAGYYVRFWTNVSGVGIGTPANNTTHLNIPTNGLTQAQFSVLGGAPGTAVPNTAFPANTTLRNHIRNNVIHTWTDTGGPLQATVMDVNYANSNTTGGVFGIDDGMKIIRPAMTLRGNHTERRTRWSISYAYANGQGTIVPNSGGAPGVNAGGNMESSMSIAGSSQTVSNAAYAAGTTSDGRSRFYDPKMNGGEGGLRTAFLYDVWVGSPTGNDGYGITFWSENNIVIGHGRNDVRVVYFYDTRHNGGTANAWRDVRILINGTPPGTPSDTNTGPLMTSLGDGWWMYIIPNTTNVNNVSISGRNGTGNGTRYRTPNLAVSSGQSGNIFYFSGNTANNNTQVLTRRTPSINIAGGNTVNTGHSTVTFTNPITTSPLPTYIPHHQNLGKVGGDRVIPHLGITQDQYTNGTWGWLADARTNIIGYWDAEQFSGSTSTIDSGGRISEWKRFYGLYTIPENQGFTEFAFQYRGSTRTNSWSGNFFTGITFETPSFVAINKSFREHDENNIPVSVNTVYRNPGDPVYAVAALTATNFGDVTARNIVITDRIAPFHEYVDVNMAPNQITINWQRRNPDGTLRPVEALTLAEVTAAINFTDNVLTVTLPDRITLATGESVTVEFRMRARSTLRSEPRYDTFGYWMRNQATVSSRDNDYLGYARTNPSDRHINHSNNVWLYIEPIRLSTEVVRDTSVTTSDIHGNADQFFDVTMSLSSTFDTRISGLINVAIPEGFTVIPNSVRSYPSPGTATPSTPRVVVNGDGSTTVVVSGIVLNAGQSVEVRYRMQYVGDKYGAEYSFIDAHYKYQYMLANNDTGPTMMTGAVSFPAHAIPLTVIKTQNSAARVAPGTVNFRLPIADYIKAGDDYELTQTNEYNLDALRYVLLDEYNNPATGNVLVRTGYRANLTADNDGVHISLTTYSDMPDWITLRYRVEADLTPTDGGNDIPIRSRITTVTVIRVDNNLVYYELYTDGSYGLFFNHADIRNTLSETLGIVETGYAVYSMEPNRSVRVGPGPGGISNIATPLGNAFLYILPTVPITGITPLDVSFGPLGNLDHIGTFHPNFAKGNASQNMFAIRTPQQMININLVGNTNGLIFNQERNLDFIAHSFMDSVVGGVFGGTFNNGADDDGNPFVIRNVTINAQSMDNVGLFSQIGERGTVSGVHLLITQSGINGRDNVGGITGVNRGLIINCVVDEVNTGSGMQITGRNNVGGIAGRNIYKMVESTNPGEDDDEYFGIIIDSEVRNAQITGDSFVGAIIGLSLDEDGDQIPVSDAICSDCDWLNVTLTCDTCNDTFNNDELTCDCGILSISAMISLDGLFNYVYIKDDDEADDAEDDDEADDEEEDEEDEKSEGDGEDDADANDTSG